MLVKKLGHEKKTYLSDENLSFNLNRILFFIFEYILSDFLGNFLQIPGFLFRCTGNIEDAELAEGKSKLCLRFIIT